jgi:trk system potassium uptake protein TrkA
MSRAYGSIGVLYVIVGGCGRTGAQLADILSEDGHDVVVCDLDETAFDRIGSSFNGETLISDVTNKAMLQNAGAAQADAFLAVTNLDNANVMAVQIATELYGVERAVARLFNPQREDSYRKMGVKFVSGTKLVAKAILNELWAYTFPQHVLSPDVEVEIVEMLITEEGAGCTVGDLERHGGVRVAAVQRGDRVSVPRFGDELRVDDVVIAGLRRGAARKLGGMVTSPVRSATDLPPLTSGR